MRVDPERTRRYLKRTLARPERSIALSIRDQEAHEKWQREWHRGPQGQPPYSVEWMNRVEAYCRSKGLGSPTFTITDNYADMTKTLSWETT